MGIGSLWHACALVTTLGEHRCISPQALRDWPRSGPNEGPLWLAAHLLFDGAGGLFGLYLLAGLGLSVAGYIARGGRDKDPAGRRPEP
jgi:hypothetical protein